MNNMLGMAPGGIEPAYLETYVGTKNADLDKNGKTDAFQIEMRVPCPISMRVRQLSPFIITVDEKQFDASDVQLKIRGQVLPSEYLGTINDIWWLLGEKGLITVKQKGGLTKGKHKLTMNFGGEILVKEITM